MCRSDRRFCRYDTLAREDAANSCRQWFSTFLGAYFDFQILQDIVEAYDSRENVWKEVAPLITGRGSACAVVVQK